MRKIVNWNQFLNEKISFKKLTNEELLSMVLMKLDLGINEQMFDLNLIKDYSDEEKKQTIKQDDPWDERSKKPLRGSSVYYEYPDFYRGYKNKPYKYSDTLRTNVHGLYDDNFSITYYTSYPSDISKLGTTGEYPNEGEDWKKGKLFNICIWDILNTRNHAVKYHRVINIKEGEKYYDKIYSILNPIYMRLKKIKDAKDEPIINSRKFRQSFRDNLDAETFENKN